MFRKHAQTARTWFQLRSRSEITASSLASSCPALAVGPFLGQRTPGKQKPALPDRRRTARGPSPPGVHRAACAAVSSSFVVEKIGAYEENAAAIAWRLYSKYTQLVSRPRRNCGARNVSLTGALTASKNAVPRCRRPRSRRRHGSGSGCGRHKFCFRSLSSLTVQEISPATRECDARILSCFFLSRTSTLNCQDYNVRQRDTPTFGTSLVATSGPLSKHGPNRTLNAPVGQSFRALYRN